MEMTGQTVSVYGFDDDAPPLRNIPIATCITGYTLPTGETVILVLHQALYLGKTHEGRLLCPNQLCQHGIRVDDCPKHLALGLNTTHSITSKEDDLVIPLNMDGTISYFDTHLPSKAEIRDCKHIVLTSPEEWDPKSDVFDKEERKFAALDSGDRLTRHIGAFAAGNDLENVLCEADPTLSDNYWMEEIRNMAPVSTGNPTKKLTPEILSSMWGIGLETARNTLNATTQSVIWQSVHPLERRYRTAHKQFRYNQLNDRFYADVMFSGHKSLSGNTCATVFVNGGKFSFVYPQVKKGDTDQALATFYDMNGIPYHLHTDGGGEFTSKKWNNVRVTGGTCKQTLTEPHSPWQNAAEMEIKELKKQTQRLMRKSKCSPRLWDYCLVYVSEIRSRTAFGNRKSKKRTGYEIVTGNTPDISEWADFTWYQPVWYLDDEASWPEEKQKLARWLGVSQGWTSHVLFFTAT